MDFFNKKNENLNHQKPTEQTPVYVNDANIKNPYQQSQFVNQNLNNDQLAQNLGFNQPVHSPVRPNFTKKELEHVEVPNQIAKEIRLQKLSLAGIMFIGFVLLFVSTFFVLVHYLAPIVDQAQLKIPLSFIPNPVVMIILMIVSLLFFIIGLIDSNHLRIGLKSYKTDLLMGVEKIPFFIIRNYKALIARPIYMNWISFSIYFWGGIVIGIFFIIKTASKNNPSMNTEIIIMIAILGSTLFIHIVSLFFTRARKGNINAYYGYEIVPFDQVKDVRKRTNRICMVIFFILLTLVLFIVIIPWMIVRKNKNKAIIPFL
ncbi:MSC_0882 family membrane protein [Williamsoniiplasma lucivorax]|uniref:Uncharacterized protein n=1 Tax=Williamsoniiplasma lucivorax TaxID=209274 RepID=A0A2S5RDM6_9MOLU|nr:hypothetical protein [Williamsoniiplasma lucivorax]PPE05225.1 hypothetical protein ELUCI_v1c07610 [Williamsoniiplasma lucivorax]